MSAITSTAGVLLMGLAIPLAAQRVETGFLNRAIVKGDVSYPYQVYVPADYTPTEAWPAILFLHGAGERGADGLLQTTVGLAPAVRAAAARFPAIIIFPQVPRDSQWVGTPADAAFEALQRTMTEFRVDADRVYLTGLSMGGHGTWYMAYHHPDVFAAVAPICGWIPDMPRFRGSVPVVPEDSGPPLPALARQLRNVPIWIFHGEMDRVVPVAGSREPAEVLREAGATVHYTELLGLDHNSWDAAYGSKEFTDWLFAQRRPK